jgi:hypothetical protein
MKYIKEQNLHERKIKDRSLIIKENGAIELTPPNGTLLINGDLLVTGAVAGPEVGQLTYYVSLEGNDNNSGTGPTPDRAKRTVKAAVEAAPAGATIRLAPGDYYENNPITLKERQTVRGDSLRNTQIWPLNNQDDIFFVDNACYIFQITFRGLRDPGWCVRIKPGSLVTTSPYVQNCSNINGPWLNDGTEFVPFETVQIEGVAPGARPIINNTDVPLSKRVNEIGGGNGMLVDGNDYDQRSLVFSMVADAFTQIAQGAIGFHITNFGYTQIVSCFTVFCRTGFLTTNGGYLSISNSVSDFGTFALIADGVFDEVYTTARPVQDYFSTIASITVTTQGEGYSSVPTVVIDPPVSPGGVQATALASIDPTTGKVTSVSIQNAGSGYTVIPDITFVGGGFSVSAEAVVNLSTNRIITVNSLRDVPQVGSIISFEGDNTKYYITETDTTVQPFIYDETVCRRDVRRIVDAVVGDMVMGTNYQAIAAGRSYLRSTSQKVLREQLEPTIYGIESARDSMLLRIPDSNPANETARYEIIERFAIITNIIEQGDSTSAPDIIYNDLVSIDSGVVAAKDNIVANKEFIIEELTKYISEQFTNLSYNQDSFETVIRSVTAAVTFDVALGTNFNAVTSGKTYLRGIIPNTVEFINSFIFLKSQIAGISAVNTVPTALSRANAAMDELIEIISLGDSTSADDLVFPSPTGGLSSRTNAKDQLRANREFIIAETIAHITQEFPDLVYDIDRSSKNAGYIVDALSYDILYGGDSAIRISTNGYFIGTNNQLDAEENTATISAYERLQTVISDIIQGVAISVTTGNTVPQNFTSGNGTGTEGDNAVELLGYVIQVLEDESNENLVDIEYPSYIWATNPIQDAANAILAQRNNFAEAVTEYILETYPTFTYDRTKCKRDVELIVDAVARDMRLGTNHNGIVAGNAYRRATASVVDAEQFPATILALRFLKSELETIATSSTTALTRVRDSMEALLNIVEYDILPSEGMTFPAPTIASQAQIDAARQLQDNRTFLVEETIAYIDANYPLLTYDDDRIRNDAGDIVDGVTHDLLYGGNRSTLISARSFYDDGVSTIPGIEDEIADAFERVRDVAIDVIEGAAVIKTPGNPEDQVLIPGFGTATESSNASDLFDIVIDAITGGLITTPQNQNPDYSWVNSTITVIASDMLNKNNILQQSVIDYITNEILGFSYNVAKCERDTGYIIDAALYDLMYGGNLQTRRAMEAYYSNAVIVGQEDITEFSYKHLANVMRDVSRNVAITPSTGVTFTQIIGPTAGSVNAANTLSTLINKIADVIGGAGLPVEIGHSYEALNPGDLNNKRILILADLDDIEDEAIFDLNLEFGGVSSLTLFPGVLFVNQNTLSSLQNISTISTSGHAFEYVGAGITYNALPFFGGTPIQENQVIETNNGKVFWTSSDQIGNFEVGNYFNVNALTGDITLNANQLNLLGITSIGPFQRDGILVGVALTEVSDSTDLLASTGIAESDTVPTQNAVVNYVENRYLNKLTGGTVNGPVEIDDDTVSIDVTTGALVVNGGVGIADDVNIGGTLDVAGAVTFTEELTVPNGGTGNATFTLYGVVYGNNGDALQVTAAGTSGQVLKVGVDGIPFFGDPDGGTY